MNQPQQQQCTRAEAFALRGRGASFFHKELREGLMVPALIPGRCARYSVPEVMACTEAAVAGWPKPARRELVQELIALRSPDLPATPAELAQAAAERYAGAVPPRPPAVRRRVAGAAA